MSAIIVMQKYSLITCRSTGATAGDEKDQKATKAEGINGCMNMPICGSGWATRIGIFFFFCYLILTDNIKFWHAPKKCGVTRGLLDIERLHQ